MLNFSSSLAHTLHRTHPVTCHMMGQYTIHALLPGHVHWSFLYYRKPRINLIYQTAAIWFSYVALYAQCSTISSVSLYTSHRTQKQWFPWQLCLIACISQRTHQVTHHLTDHHNIHTQWAWQPCSMFNGKTTLSPHLNPCDSSYAAIFQA